MIRATDFLANEGRFQSRFESFRNEEIIDAPSDVPVSGLEEVTPPGVFLGFIRVKMPEGIGKSSGYEFPQSIPFFVSETRITVVRFRV